MNNSQPNYLNRELSWLEFDQRVLDEALDSSVPLLERLKFLAISASNKCEGTSTHTLRFFSRKSSGRFR